MPVLAAGRPWESEAGDSAFALAATREPEEIEVRVGGVLKWTLTEASVVVVVAVVVVVGVAVAVVGGVVEVS